MIIIPSQNMNAEKWGEVSLTGRDISLDLKALIDDSMKGLMRSLGDAGVAPSNQTGKTALKLLDDILSGGAGAGLAKAQVRDAANAWTDVGFYTGNLNMPVDLKANTIGVAQESGGNLASIVSQLDISISALRDAITDAGVPKDLKDLWDDLETIKGDTPALNDDSVKGLLRSLGDAGAAPSNTSGKTALKLLTDILAQVDSKTSTLAKETGGNLATLVGKDFATQTTLAAQLNITLSALRDAITDGATPKDLKDLYDELILIKGQLDNKTSTLATQTTLATLALESGGNLAAIVGKDFATQTTLAAQLDVALSTRFQNSDLRGSSPDYGNVIVGDTATLIKAANASRKSLFIQNLGTDNMYFGNDASVTTANAPKMLPGQGAEFIFCTSAVYGISDGGNIDVRYWESG